MQRELTVILAAKGTFEVGEIQGLCDRLERLADFELLLFSTEPQSPEIQSLSDQHPRFFSQPVLGAKTEKEATLKAIDAARGKRVLLLPPGDRELWGEILSSLSEPGTHLFMPAQGVSRLGLWLQRLTGLQLTANAGILADPKELVHLGDQLDLENQQLFPLLKTKTSQVHRLPTPAWGANRGYDYWVELYHVTLGRFFPFSLLQYSLVGTSGVVVNLGTLNLGLWAGLSEPAALAWALELPVLTNFWLNNLWTFAQHRVTRWGWLVGLAKFHLVCTVGAGINYSLALFLSLKLGLNLYLADLVGILIATLWNYLLNKRFTWGQK